MDIRVMDVSGGRKEDSGRDCAIDRFRPFGEAEYGIEG